MSQFTGHKGPAVPLLPEGHKGVPKKMPMELGMDEQATKA